MKQDRTRVLEEAAFLLDTTHSLGERGPHTFLARQRLASWLDTRRGNKGQLYADIAWLRKLGATVGHKS